MIVMSIASINCDNMAERTVKEMHMTDWNCNFSELPGWDQRETFHDAYDEFHELPRKDLLCCVYSIVERRMLDYRGYLALFQNKSAPELVLNISEYTFCPTFFASEDGNLIFLQPCVYLPKFSKAFYPVLILDIEKKRFSVALPRNTSGIHRITQNKSTVFTVVRSGHGSRKIRSRWCKWYSLNRLPMLPQLLG